MSSVGHQTFADILFGTCSRLLPKEDLLLFLLGDVPSCLPLSLQYWSQSPRMSFHDYPHFKQGNTCLDFLVSADRFSGYILVYVFVAGYCSLENPHLDVKLMYIASSQFPCLRNFHVASFLCFYIGEFFELYVQCSDSKE